MDCKTSKEDLKAMFPSLTDAKAQLLAETLNKFSKFYGIDTKEKLQHFLAQAGVETDNFSSFREGTNFQPTVVMGKFGKYFNGLNNESRYTASSLAVITCEIPNFGTKRNNKANKIVFINILI